MARTRCAEETRRLFNSQIIAILAAILFPVFARAREKARQTSCLSNNKQFALALMMYAQDNNEFLPPAMMGEVVDGTRVDVHGFPVLLHPYTNNWGIWECPSTGGTSPTFQPDPDDSATYPLSYIANYRMMPWGDWPHEYPEYARGAALAKIEKPAERVLIAERAPDYGGWGTVDPGNNRVDRAVHNGGSNYCFADGHAKWLQETAFLTNWETYWGTDYWFND